jgi:hypothetical protein
VSAGYAVSYPDARKLAARRAKAQSQGIDTEADSDWYEPADIYTSTTINARTKLEALVLAEREVAAHSVFGEGELFRRPSRWPDEEDELVAAIEVPR